MPTSGAKILSLQHAAAALLPRPIHDMRIRTFVLAVAVACSAAACGHKRAAATTADTAQEPVAAPETEHARTFPMPEAPAILQSVKETEEYLLLHYWEAASLSDTTWLGDADVLEEAFVRFIAAAQAFPDRETSLQAVRNMMKALPTATAPDVTHLLTGFADKYLYDPNSPLRNEDMYIEVLRGQIDDPALDDLYKIAPRERLRMALKNRPGDRAADFGFATADGDGTLYGIEADYTLLFFYNLGCPACAQVHAGLEAVMSREPIAAMLRDGRMKVLALYPDSDLSGWRDHSDEIPAGWINAIDPRQAINNGSLYDLRAIPSLYLLDDKKTVILKDFTEPALLAAAIAGTSAQ